MKNVMYCVLLILITGACVTPPEKWIEARIDTIGEQCKQEYLAKQPSTARWYNLKTQERNKKKKEYDEFKKKQLDLYRALHTFQKLYLDTVNPDGTCKNNECMALEKLRLQIIEACPFAGESLPVVKAK